MVRVARGSGLGRYRRVHETQSRNCDVLFHRNFCFAFVTVRNSQPFVPPVGTFSDYLSFFWAEAILGNYRLLSVVMTWLFRKPA